MEDAIENSVRNNGDAPFDYETDPEDYADLLEHPIDLNRANREELNALIPILLPTQINTFFEYRTKYGKLISIYELQSIFDLPTIRKILPFVVIHADFKDYSIQKSQLFQHGSNDLYLLWDKRLEQSEGFLRTSSDTRLRYLGDPNNIHVRYRYHYGTRLSYGFTATKSAGEQFFTASNPNGFDFYSAHFFIKDPFKGVKTLAIGDFSVSMGQGLVGQNGFSIGKNASALNIEHNSPTLRKYSSSNEYNFMRGIGAQIDLGKQFDATVFASYHARDATIQTAKDSTPLQTNELVATTLQTSGLHRTRTEIKDKATINVFSAGAILRYFFNRGHIALNTQYNKFDKRIEPTIKRYNANAFRGTEQLNVSLDYKYSIKNLHFFGEEAVSNAGAISTTNGAMIALGKKTNFSIHYRALSKSYNANSAQTFSQTGAASNETGLYIGGMFQPNKFWTINGYTDFWQHPNPRYLVDSASHGREFFLKADFKTKKLESYLQIRHVLDQTNASGNIPAGAQHPLVDKTRTQIRFNLSRKISKNLEWRNRAELSFYSKETTQSAGWLIHQDVIYKSPQIPLHLSARIAFYNTKDYNSAIYDYENDLLYQFTILPSYFNGTRAYINIAYKIQKHWTTELRLANTYLFNKTTIGTGLDQIQSPHRTDVKVQMHIDF